MQLEIQRKEIISQQDYLETRDSLLQVLGPRTSSQKTLMSDCDTRSFSVIVLVPAWVVQFKIL